MRHTPIRSCAPVVGRLHRLRKIVANAARIGHDSHLLQQHRGTIPGGAPQSTAGRAIIMTQRYYDSAQIRKPLISEVRNLWVHRDVVRLIAQRDVTARYKRTVLGIWWTLLNPLLMTLVLWIIFGNFFRFETPGVPFVVYLLSGILMVTYWSQTVLAAGTAVVGNANILSKVYIPPEVFSVGAAMAAFVNFVIALLPLLVIQLITGIGVPWSVILAPIVIFFILAFATGLGLVVASAAVFFYDVIDFTAVLIQMASYLTPTFYPLTIVPEQFLWLIYINPLYSQLTVFRAVMYGGYWEWWHVGYGSLSAIAMLVLGAWLFSRSRDRLVIML